MVGIDEQFAQINFAPPPSVVNPVASGTGVSVAQVNNPVLVSGENVSSKVLSDDERSDHGSGGGGGGGGGTPVVGLRKPPLPLQPLVQQKGGGGGNGAGGGGGGGYSLPSPDSVARYSLAVLDLTFYLSGAISFFFFFFSLQSTLLFNSVWLIDLSRNFIIING